MGLVNTLTFGLLGTKEQNFLEAKPYYDQSTVPVNTFKNKTPHTCLLYTSPSPRDS